MDLWNIYKTLVIAVGSGYQSAISHCVKSARILNYSGLHFPAFGLNTKYLSVFIPNAGKCRPK